MNNSYLPIEEIWGAMSESARERALQALPGLKGVFAYVFPYFAGREKGNISVYARGKDYHIVLGRELRATTDRLRCQYPEAEFVPFVDASPFPEVYAAAAAGLGVIGKNNLLITPEYGSFVFIGLIATDLELKSCAQASQSCIGCGACIRACPGGALKDGSFDKTACLSDITQRKGELTEAERELVRRSGMMWGCDICQTVCPMNRAAALTDIGEFKDDLICSLSAADIPNTNREFKAKYGAYAFSWRGRAPLARNGEILKEG